MIEALTPEQEALLPVYRDKWIEIGLSTEKMNFEKAVEAAKKCYELAGLEAPQDFYHCLSPVDAIQKIKELNPEFTEHEILGHHIYGNHEAGWLSFYEFFKDETEVQGLECIEGLVDLAKECGWWAPYDTAAFLQERPEVLAFDDADVLHSETGPAVKYRDGYSLYFWHGTSIPAEWIEEKEALTPQTALTWENVEQRRCACEIVGWDRILDELDAKVIDVNPNPEIGQLLQVEMEDVGEMTFLRVRCGTGRGFALPVPPETQTAMEAQAWLNHETVVDFKLPGLRT